MVFKLAVPAVPPVEAYLKPNSSICVIEISLISNGNGIWRSVFVNCEKNEQKRKFCEHFRCDLELQKPSDDLKSYLVVSIDTFPRMNPSCYNLLMQLNLTS